MILPKPVLTDAEAKVAALLKNGLSNGEIALALGLSLSTVKYHLTSVYKKSGVSSDRQFLATVGSIVRLGA